MSNLLAYMKEERHDLTSGFSFHFIDIHFFCLFLNTIYFHFSCSFTLSYWMETGIVYYY